MGDLNTLYTKLATSCMYVIYDVLQCPGKTYKEMKSDQLASTHTSAISIVLKNKYYE